MCENCNDFQLLLYRVERDHDAAIEGMLQVFYSLRFHRFVPILIFFCSKLNFLLNFSTFFWGFQLQSQMIDQTVTYSRH